MKSRNRGHANCQRDRIAGVAERHVAIGRWGMGVAASALIGAGALGAIVAVRAVIYPGAILADPSALGSMIAWAALAGGGAGGVYGIVVAPLRRVPVVGPYLAGMMAAGAYCVVLIRVVIPHIEHRPFVADPADWGVGIVLTVAFGLVVGYQLERARE